MKKLAIIIIGGAAVMASSSTFAEQAGGILGRTLDPAANQGNTAEATYRAWSGTKEMGVRLTHRLNERALVYGDFVKADGEYIDDVDVDGDGYGAGILYFLPGKIEGYDVAARASYHTQDLDGAATAENIAANVELENTLLSFELLVSPLEPMNDKGMNWYAGLGVTKFELDQKVFSKANGRALTDFNDKIDDTEVSGSAGIVLPTSFGNAFAAVEYHDGAMFGVGLRYNF